MHVIAAKAVAFSEALQPEFRGYAEQVVANASALAAGVQKAGFEIVSGGTDNHLFLLSLADREITGKTAESVLEQAGLTTNKNLVPFDPRKAMVTSGIRIGTPAVTTRGMGEREMSEIASFIVRALESVGDDRGIAEIRSEAEDFCRRFPLYSDRWSEQD